MYNEYSKEELKNIFLPLLSKISYYQPSKVEKYKMSPEAGVMILEVTIHEVTGGSCWSESYEDYREIVYGEEDIATTLKQSLYEICIDLQHVFLIEEYSFKKICRDIADEAANICLFEDKKYEYYGNSTTYGFFQINVKDLLLKICNEEALEVYRECIEENATIE